MGIERGITCGGFIAVALDMLDLSVNMLTMQALNGGKITVFGGDQTRPNIHIDDLIRVYLHFLELGATAPGIYNAGFENISIMDIANMVKEFTDAEIIVTESNDPRSYRLSSKKLLRTGFAPAKTVRDAIREVSDAYHAGTLKDVDLWYNIRTMKKMIPVA